MTALAIGGGLFLGVVISIISGLIGIGRGVSDSCAGLRFRHVPETAQGTSVATLLLPIGISACWNYYKAGHVDLNPRY